MRVKLLPLVLLFVLYPAVVGATTRYVKASCSVVSTYNPGADTCTGGADLVYTTIQGGINALVAGDTLDIRAGTYVEYIVVSSAHSGTSLAPTVIQGHTGETVILRPTTVDVAGGNNVVWAYGSYFTFSNLDITGAGLPNGPTNLVAWGLNDGVTVSHHIILQDSTVEHLDGVIAAGAGSGCIASFGAHHTDMTYTNVIVHDCGAGSTTHNPGEHCLYVPGTRYIVDHVQAYNCHTAGVQIYSGGTLPSDNTVRYSVIHNTGATAIIVSERTAKIYGNIIYTFGTDTTNYPASAGIRFAAYGGSVVVYHNTIWNGATGSTGIDTASSGTTVKNNVINTVTTGISDTGSSNTYSNNICPATISTKCTAGAPAFVSTAGANFNLDTGSAAINAGVTLAGSCPTGMNCSFLGSAPDAGALEAPIKNNFSVDGATVTLTWDNAFTPIVLVTNPTCRKNAVADVVTGCAAPAAGANTFTCTLTSAAINTDTVDCSFVAAGVQSSHLLGNLAAVTGRGANLALTNSAVTNVTSGSVPVFTQQHQQIYQLVGGANTAATVLGCTTEDSNCTLPSPSAFRVRSAVKDTVADAPASGLECWVSEGGGAYAQIPAASANGGCGAGVNLCMSAIPGLGNFAITTERQTASGTFVAGAVIQDQSATPNIAWATNKKAEQECSVQIAPGVSLTTTFDFRMRRTGGVALDTYTNTVRVTVGPPLALLTSGVK